MAKAQQTPEDQEAPATSAQVVALAGRVIEQLRVVNARLDNSRARSRNKPIVLANAPLPLNPLGKEWQPTAGGAAVGTLPPQPDDEGAIGPVSSHSPTKRLCHPGTYAAPQPLQQLHSLPPTCLRAACLPPPALQLAHGDLNQLQDFYEEQFGGARTVSSAAACRRVLCVHVPARGCNCASDNRMSGFLPLACCGRHVQPHQSRPGSAMAARRAAFRNFVTM